MQAAAAADALKRREALLSLGAMIAVAQAHSPPAALAKPAGDPVPVGSFLPAAGEGLVLYKPDDKKTPVSRSSDLQIGAARRWDLCLWCRGLMWLLMPLC